MKTLTLALFAALTAAAFAADTPEQIAADYREKAAAALKKVNDTLEKATIPLIADLVKKGDTEGADMLKTQLKDKIAGEPVLAPQASASSLFKSYDTARARALEPAQKSAISRIEALLASSEGKKLDVVSSLGKVRAEIESMKTGKLTQIPAVWTYHKTPTSVAMAKVFFDGDGTLRIEDGAENPRGTWQIEKDGKLSAKLPRDTWAVAIKKDYAELDSQVVGRRFLIPVK